MIQRGEVDLSALTMKLMSGRSETFSFTKVVAEHNMVLASRSSSAADGHSLVLLFENEVIFSSSDLLFLGFSSYYTRTTLFYTFFICRFGS